jgi:hypothetical protein
MTSRKNQPTQHSPSWRLAAFAILACLLSSCASTSTSQRTTRFPDGFLIVTVSKGTLHTKHTGQKTIHKVTDSITGKTVDFTKEEVVATGVDSVPCGPQDGFQNIVLILGLPDGPNEVIEEFEHPLFLPPEDKLGTSFTRRRTVVSRNAKALWGHGWIFDSPTQQVPGKWTTRLKYRGQVIFEKSVEAVPPP